MKKIHLFSSVILSFALLFSGCGAGKTVQMTGIVAAAGTAIGAGVGALVNGGKGAAWGAGIGAVVGAGAGAIIGNKMDKQRKELAALEAAKVESINDGMITKVTFDSGILFALNSSSLSADAQRTLTQFANSLNNTPETDIKIEGHTDSSGGEKINLPLSQKRADSVKSFLESKNIAPQRMITEGLGSAQPVAQEDAKGVQALNRRVEIYIVPGAKMIEEANKAAAKKY